MSRRLPKQGNLTQLRALPRKDGPLATSSRAGAAKQVDAAASLPVELRSTLATYAQLPPVSLLRKLRLRRRSLQLYV